MSDCLRSRFRCVFGEAFSAALGADWFAQLKSFDEVTAGDDRRKCILANIHSANAIDFQACMKIIVIRKMFCDLLLTYYRLQNEAKVLQASVWS